MYDNFDQPEYHATSTVRAGKIKSITACDDGIFNVSFADGVVTQLDGRLLGGCTVHKGDYLVIYEDDYVAVMSPSDFNQQFSRLQ